MKDDGLLHKWVNGTLNAEELETFKRRPEYESLVALYKNTENLAAPSFEEENMLAGILQQPKAKLKPTVPARRVFLSSWVKYGLAASVLLLATWFMWPDNLVKYKLAKGEHKEGILPDQSTFVLNAESRLTYDPDDWENNRVINLHGEAFFQVEKGEKFEVITKNGSVQVLGTSFNVRSRRATIEVICKTGKVAVRANDSKIVHELNPKDAIRLSMGKDPIQWQESDSNSSGWISGNFSFRKAPLLVVLKELERQFDIEIDAGAVDTREIISCHFQNKDLELALKTTLGPLEIQYDSSNKKKIILTK